MASSEHAAREGSEPGDELPADYKPYVPVAKRRAALLGQLTKRHQAKRIKTAEEVEEEQRAEERDAEAALERAREKARRERTLLQAAQEVKERRAKEGKSFVVFRPWEGQVR